MKIRANQHVRPGQCSLAFTLLEVIIACAIFFLVAFSVLQVVTTGLVAARKLQQREPDFEFLISPHAITNILVEGAESGDFEQIVPGLYRGYSWAWEIMEYSSNSFFKVDYVIYNNTKGASERRLTAFFYKPGSPPGSATRAR